MNACHWLRSAAAIAAVLTLGNLSGSAWADDDAAVKPASPGATAPHGDAAKKHPAKDPTASAFALPNGVTLNAKQQAAFDQLKSDKQPELQQAIDDLQNAKSGETGPAAKKVRDLRAEIHKKINDILYPVTAPSSKDNASNGGTSDGGAPSGYGYAPYGGYYPYGYGGYYPYYYRHPRTTDGKTPGTKNGTSGDHKVAPHPPAARPAGGAAASGGAKR
jgi:hypothetical protein